MDYFEHIDDYLLGRLSDVDLNVFSAELERSAELKKAAEERRILVDHFEMIEDEKLYNRVKRIHQKNINLSSDPKPFTKPIYWLLAIVLALSAAWMIYTMFSDKESPQELYATHYTIKEINFGTRDNDATVDLRLIEAGRYYTEGDYRRALDLFKVVLKDRNHPKAQLASGLCYLELGQTDAALVEFNSLIAQKDPLQTNAARWYAALAYLTQNEVAEARKLLSSLIEDSNSHYYDRARELIRELR